MELSTVALFWRDTAACCFTTCRFHAPTAPIETAQRLAACLEQLSTLQLYCVIANLTILPWQPRNQAPVAGTQQRLELSFAPTEPLNLTAGIQPIKLTIPGPNSALSAIFATNPADLTHPDWQRLEHEIIPVLRLPNGLPISQTSGHAQILRARLVELAPEYRPQPGRPPVDAAISAALKKLDTMRSHFTRAQRANQPLEFELAKVERYQRQLSFLQSLHQLEQSAWQQLFPPTTNTETDALPPIEKLVPIIERTYYLPACPQPTPPEWADLTPADFANPELWAQLGQLKDKFPIASARSFWRTIARLRQLGLRTLPAKQDHRIRLFYRPEAERILTNLTTTPTPPQASPFDQIWQAIAQLQSQQQVLLDSINKLNSSSNSSKKKPRKIN